MLRTLDNQTSHFTRCLEDNMLTDAIMDVGNNREREDVKSWVKGMQEAYLVAQERAEECASRAKKRDGLKLKS